MLTRTDSIRPVDDGRIRLTVGPHNPQGVQVFFFLESSLSYGLHHYHRLGNFCTALLLTTRYFLFFFSSCPLSDTMYCLDPSHGVRLPNCFSTSNDYCNIKNKNNDNNNRNIFGLTRRSRRRRSIRGDTTFLILPRCLSSDN